MELPAITAVDVGENRNDVLCLAFGRKHDHLFRWHGSEHVDPRRSARLLRQILARSEIVELALQQVITVFGDIGDPRPELHLEYAGNGRLDDIARRYTVQLFSDLLFRLGVRRTYRTAAECCAR